jgi:hypothetical protein
VVFLSNSICPPPGVVLRTACNNVYNRISEARNITEMSDIVNAIINNTFIHEQSFLSAQILDSGIK